MRVMPAHYTPIEGCQRCKLLVWELESKKRECEQLREQLVRQTDETRYWQSKTAKTGRA